MLCDECNTFLHRKKKHAHHIRTALKFCQKCDDDETEASVNCVECKLDFCVECDNFFHKKGKKKTHTRSLILASDKNTKTDFGTGEISIGLDQHYYISLSSSATKDDAQSVRERHQPPGMHKNKVDGKDVYSIDHLNVITPQHLDIRLDDKILGRGNFGVVRESKYHLASVAVKQLHDVSALAMDEFVHEVLMNVYLHNHPNVPSLIGACLEPGHLCLVMEVKEGTLEDKVVQSSIQTPNTTVLNMLLDAARAVHYLHEKRVIHRDIAARNFLLDKSMQVYVYHVYIYVTYTVCISLSFIYIY